MESNKYKYNFNAAACKIQATYRMFSEYRIFMNCRNQFLNCCNMIQLNIANIFPGYITSTKSNSFYAVRYYLRTFKFSGMSRFKSNNFSNIAI